MKGEIGNNRIPISTGLDQTLEAEKIRPLVAPNKKRLFQMAAIAVFIAILASFVAKGFILLINFVTNLAFYGKWSIAAGSPANNNIGLWVLVIPVIGGIIVGLMALYGSKAIRGHGIPEAMEQILTNQSRIRPIITFLKPISAAIAIGTGGPFGAEGPIIATGGALGSSVGQILSITPNERKILLAAGAAAGMSAIFNSPIAAVFLAIELLLFEFSPRSIIPVALASITGAVGHDLLFETGPVFPMAEVANPHAIDLAVYSGLGVITGVIAVLITKSVYAIEDAFEKLPIHWMWWPAIGGLAVGIAGYFAPRTLGVGYNNITDVLSGSLPVVVVISLCVLKYISWSVSLGSGSSGGTLAPLLTIGGATGYILAWTVTYLFPHLNISLTLAALVCMTAMFAGASRAYLTSIIFGVESTGQTHALLPLLGACTASYFISFFLMENSLMTEKISRRGVKAPNSYEPDILEKLTVRQVIKNDSLVLNSENSVAEVRNWLKDHDHHSAAYFIVVNDQQVLQGIITLQDIFSIEHNEDTPIADLVQIKPNTIAEDNTLRTAVEIMSMQNFEVLPVVSRSIPKQVVGVLSYKDILAAYRQQFEENLQEVTPSLRHQGLRILLQGQKLLTVMRGKD